MRLRGSIHTGVEITIYERHWAMQCFETSNKQDWLSGRAKNSSQRAGASVKLAAQDTLVEA